MPALKITGYGGMIPIMDETLLPEGAASLAQNTWLYAGNMQGQKAPRLIKALTNGTAKRVARFPLAIYGDTDFLNSVYMEFVDPDIDVIRGPILQDQYNRYYWAGSITSPAYNTETRIQAGSASYKLGIPAPATGPSISPAVTAADVTAPVAASAIANATLIVISMTEARALDASNPPPVAAFKVNSGLTEIPVTAVAIDSSTNKVLLTLSAPCVYGEVVTVQYVDPSAQNDEKAIQDLAGNDAVSFLLTCTNNTGDTNGPTFVSASVNGTSLVIQMSDAANLDATNIPATTAFKVLVDNVDRTVSGVSVSGGSKTVTLTLSSAVQPYQAVLLTYVDPTASNDTSAIQDTFGNDAPGWIKQVVANNSLDTVPPKVTSLGVLYSLLTLTYDKELDNNIAVPTSRFTVLVNGSNRAVVSVTTNQTAKTVTLGLTSAVALGDTVYLTYSNTTPANNTIRDLAPTPNNAASLSNVQVQNMIIQAPPPVDNSP